MTATKPESVEIHWLNVQKDFDENFRGLTMASEEHRKASVLRLYPDYAESYDDDEGPLMNWICAMALDNGCRVSEMQEAVRNKLDPIFGDGGANGLQPFVWYLA
jgi:hypothetical protein